MRKRNRPTADRLRELFHYDPSTGVFVRRKPARSWTTQERKYGQVGAGRISELGYVLVMVDNINYNAGVLAWLYVHGEWPDGKVRYINGQRLDNRIENIEIPNLDEDELKKRPLTVERLKELLHYEPETGWFTWRVNSSLCRSGDRAGGYHGFGYRSIGLDYKKYLEHTLAFLYMTGKWPGTEIDHINRSKDDNRWSNLRLATRSENGHNKPMHRRNATGFIGVHAHGKKYRSLITIDGTMFNLGRYNTIAEARIARLLGEVKHLGKFTSYNEEKDGALPFGDVFIATMVRGNSLYVLDSNNSPVEVTDVTQIESVPVTETGDPLH